MRLHIRISCAALLAGLITALASALVIISPPAAQAAFGVEEHAFEAGTCKTSSCTYASVQANPGEAFTQAAGHPPVGLTAFEFNHHDSLLGKEPEGAVKNIRVDLPPGLAGNPEALPKCPVAAFQKDECKPETQVGTNELTVFDGINNMTVSGTVYNLEQPPGLALDFGIHVAVEPLVSVHIYLEGHVSWSSDYHEYFQIDNIPHEGEVLGAKVPLAVLKSKLIFNGRAGQGDFLTLPSACSSTTTTYLEVQSWEGQVSRTQTHTPVGVEGCGAPPFQPTAEVKPETAQSDEPDGASTEVKVPQHAGPDEIDTADIRDAHVTLPEGLTLNPSAARGLQACTASQIAIGSTSSVTCPPASAIGTVAIETDLPPGSLAGPVYLGSPSGAPITDPPYTIYLDAESVYGVSVRLKGSIVPDPTTGRLEATFTENPQLPFSSLVLKLRGGAQAPLANPLTCGSTPTQALFTPYTGGPPALSSTPFSTTGCPAPLPFSLAQSTANSTAGAGAYTSYTLNLAREHGQQYLSQIKTVLPAGLLGTIPSVALCGEPQAGAGHLLDDQSDRDRHRQRRGRSRTLCLLRSRLPDGLLQRGALRPVDRGAGKRRAVRPRQRALPLRAHPRRAQHRPLHRPRDRHQHASQHRQGRAAATEERERGGQPPQLPLQPDKLRGARHRLDAHLDIRRDPEPCRAPFRRTTAARWRSSPPSRSQPEPTPPAPAAPACTLTSRRDRTRPTSTPSSSSSPSSSPPV